MADEDSWWSEACRLAESGEDGFGEGDHGACDTAGCDCSCHNPPFLHGRPRFTAESEGDDFLFGRRPILKPTDSEEASRG